MVKKFDVTQKYSREILKIKNILQQLENGRVYEISGVRNDGYLATNVIQLKEIITELLYKIEYDKDSLNDEISKILDKIDL
ncbi:MAG: hypothetical protein GT589_00200 [Peptoclostridium sp.]|nr:hypothetical protein [Peptoclostridium sp.]